MASISCPRCGNPVDQDFGVVTCSRCQAVLFVNMDGQVQITEEAGEQQAHSEESQAGFPSEEQPQEIFANDELESVSTSSATDLQFETDENEAGKLERAFVEESVPLDVDLVPDANKGSLFEDSEAGVYQSSEQVQGPLSYSIIIENIDTKEVRQSLIQALDDSKFQWDPREIMRSLKDGVIELKNLNPVKASVVVKRVRDLPVKISWKQNVYN